jgi:hypothetical protein
VVRGRHQRSLRRQVDDYGSLLLILEPLFHFDNQLLGQHDYRVAIACNLSVCGLWSIFKRNGDAHVINKDCNVKVIQLLR